MRKRRGILHANTFSRIFDATIPTVYAPITPPKDTATQVATVFAATNLPPGEL